MNGSTGDSAGKSTWVSVKDSIWVKVGVVAAVVAAIVGTIAITRSGGGDITQATSGGSTGCVVKGDNVTVDCRGSEIPGQTIDDKLIADAQRFTSMPPKGDGPWPFAVVKTLNIGLKVRSTNVTQGEQLGGLAPHHVAWAVCQVQSNFDPDPSTGAGPQWIRIKWDQQQPSTAFFESSSGAEKTAWAYRGYLTPVGHNGEIPRC